MPDEYDVGGAVYYNTLFTFGEGDVLSVEGKFVVFHESDEGGMLMDFGGLEDAIVTYGEQIFTGVVSSPVFVAGAYATYGDYTRNKQIGNLMISEVTEVPEPTALAILALGIIGLTLRRFKKQA